MNLYLLLAAVVIIACVICNRITSRIGMPMLLAFILLGMLFGSDGAFKIPFDNYSVAEQICSVALIFIMFYGGFGTNWHAARPVAVKALVLSSLGTVLTAGFVGLFCYLVLKIALLESFLIGAVISSTDAASVFSILRSKKLNLKYNTASLLEIESGSNDPFSYMLTVVVLGLMNNGSAKGFGYMLFAQIAYGVAFGFAIAFGTLFILKRFKMSSSGFGAIFIVAVALVSYAAPAYIGGNGYLSAYITGIILGNRRLENKQELVHFFDATTGLMQMVLFFLLGLLSYPSQLPAIALTGLFVALFLTFIARPIAVFAILAPFKGGHIKQNLLVSWAGMRGAASIVFAIMAVINPAVTDNDIFHTVLFIVLFSILIQGTLIPVFARKLGLTDSGEDVMRTFTDYIDEVPVQLIQFSVPEGHLWSKRAVKDIDLPPESLLVLLTRKEKRIIPNGNTVIEAGDMLVLSGSAADRTDGVRLYERVVKKDDDFAGKRVFEAKLSDEFIMLIKRGKRVVIPKGDTELKVGDVLVVSGENELVSSKKV